jgi:hypothetical protein
MHAVISRGFFFVVSRLQNFRGFIHLPSRQVPLVGYQAGNQPDSCNPVAPESV